MCLPAALALPLTIASTVLSGVGQIMQGNQAAAMGRLQQQEYERQAQADQQAASYEMARTYEQGRRAQADATVAVAGSGVGLQGSPLDAISDIAKQNQMDVEAIQYGSTIRQGQLRTQGQIARVRGQQARTAGFIGAGTTVMGGLGSAFRPSASVQMGQNPFAGIY